MRVTGIPGGGLREVGELGGDATRGDSGDTMIRGTSVTTLDVAGEGMMVDSDSDEVGEAQRPTDGDGGRGNMAGSEAWTPCFSTLVVPLSELGGDTCSWGSIGMLSILLAVGFSASLGRSM